MSAILHDLLVGLSLVMLVYFVAIQALMFVLAIGSAIVLHREQAIERFGRVEDMLTSSLAPPVSLVIPAYNESAGIVDVVHSMSMASYPRLEIVVANDGSTDDTLAKLIEAFEMIQVPYPLRSVIPSAPVRAVYKSTLPIDLTVIDKENGGRADALNAAINAARYPYVMATDADVLIDGHALAHAMRLIAEDRDRTVAVGGNIRPLNGCSIRLGHVVQAAVPDSLLARYQILEYVRAFVSSRPAWGAINCLPLISGAFGIFRRDTLVELGGYTPGHLGEDLDLTMRIHRHYRESKTPYRIGYSPAAVVWTEVPATRAIFRRQRIRWHRGLMTAVHDFRSSFLNPRHGAVGMLLWPAQVLFEYLAPIVEFAGYVVIPIALWVGAVSPITVGVAFLMALFLGSLTSLLGLLIDERFGYFNDPLETLKLLGLVFVENLGLRQMTVWWRIRAMLGGRSTRVWGNMERRGVSRLANSH
ncbi:MAG: glycosyltransferase family 2 protein [Acidimicrobiia bacterium]